MKEVLRINYEAQGLSSEEIDKILPADEEQEVPPLDPITENINILMGKSVSAAMWQDHAAHKMVHGTFAEQHPELQAQIMAHITEHEAYEYLIKMQQMIGSELPSLEEIQNPDIQNAIALAAAGGLDASGEASNSTQGPIDPNELILADIRQKEEEVKAKERMADKKLEFDTFKTQLDFEKEKTKIESNEDIAELKAETELKKSSNQ
jgi:DNA-binding transcriptional MerR regulator